MKVTAQAHLHWRTSYTHPEGMFTFFENDMSICGPEYVCIRKVEMEVDVPDDFDPRPAQIDALRKEKTKILAEAQARANNIEEQVQRLLAIEYKPGVA